MAAKLPKEAIYRKQLVSLADLGVVPRIPFGIGPLDAMTRGGLPRGCFTLITGPLGSGKTSTGLLGIAGFHRQDKTREALIINPERKIDAAWAERLGVDPERTRFFYPGAGEQMLDVTKECLRQWQEIGFILVDSLAAMRPQREIGGDPLEDVYVANAARMNNQFYGEVCMLLCDLLKQGRTVTIVIINQERYKIVTRGNPLTNPGGVGQYFFSALWLRFLRPEYTIPEKGTPKIPLSVSFRFTVERNVDGPKETESAFSVRLAQLGQWQFGEIDDYLWVWQSARALGLLRGNKHSSQFEAPDGVGPFTLPPVRDEIMLAWHNDQEVYRKVRAATVTQYVDWRNGKRPGWVLKEAAAETE